MKFHKLFVTTTLLVAASSVSPAQQLIDTNEHVVVPQGIFEVGDRTDGRRSMVMNLSEDYFLKGTSGNLPEN